MYEAWVKKYGEEQAKYLMEEMGHWTDSYTHGALIDFEFLRHLKLEQQVQQVCAEKGWAYEEIPGELALFQKLVDGDWPEADFLTLRPGQTVVAAFDERVIAAA